MTISEPNLYILVGPPKTGTTSLQVALETSSARNLGPIRYHGVFQPRSRNNGIGSLACQLHGACLNGLKDGELADLRNEIKDLRKCSDLPLVISEEGFLFSQNKVCWAKKLERLSKIVDSDSATIVIALRDPCDGLRSFYREIFNSLPLFYRLSFRIWCRSRQARVFNYKELERVVENLGFDIWFFDMNALRDQLVRLEVVLGQNKRFAGADLHVGHENKDPNKTTSSTEYRWLPGTVFSFPEVMTSTIASKCLRLLPWFRKGNRFMINIRPAGMRRLNVPQDILYEYRTHYIQKLSMCKSRAQEMHFR